MFKSLRSLLRPAAATNADAFAGAGVELSCFGRLRDEFVAGRGLEIGGPSELVFGVEGFAPVYLAAQRLDNCNFAEHTVWEAQLHEGAPFVFDPDKAPGRQFIAEASRLEPITDASYDYLLSSHCIEHMANPLQGLAAWRRVLRPGGLLLLVVPHRDGTFDHQRPVTTLQHLRADYEVGTNEADLTHLEEILALHDLERDPWAGGAEAFRERALRNAENRCLHQHVFDTRLAIQVVDCAQFRIEAVELFPTMHIAIVARKPAAGEVVDNSGFLQEPPSWRSPFPSDAR